MSMELYEMFATNKVSRRRKHFLISPELLSPPNPIYFRTLRGVATVNDSFAERNSFKRLKLSITPF